MAQQQEISNPFLAIFQQLERVERLLTEHTKKEPEPKHLAASEDVFVTKERVAEIYGVSHVTVWQWERKGILKSYRIGNLKRFKFSEVMDAPVPIKRAQRK